MLTEKDSFDILLIEDSPTDALLVTEKLKDVSHFKFRLMIAQSLSEGAAKLSQKKFDAVILDLGLPDSTGSETLSKLRVFAPTMPVVILSGIEEFEIKEGADASMAVNFLSKNQATGNRIATALLSSIEKPSDASSAQVNHLLRYLDASLRSSTSLIKSGVELKVVLSSFCLAIEEYAAEQLKLSILAAVLLSERSGARFDDAVAPSLSDTYNQAVTELAGKLSDNLLLCSNNAGAADFVADTDAETELADYAKIARANHLKAFWHVPFRESSGAIAGSLIIHFKEQHRPSEIERELIEKSAQILGTVITRAGEIQFSK